jgi:hypothetical protein
MVPAEGTARGSVAALTLRLWPFILSRDSTDRRLRITIRRFKAGVCDHSSHRYTGRDDPPEQALCIASTPLFIAIRPM